MKLVTTVSPVTSELAPRSLAWRLATALLQPKPSSTACLHSILTTRQAAFRAAATTATGNHEQHMWERLALRFSDLCAQTPTRAKWP